MGKYQPCWCDSGRLYADCHRAIDAMSANGAIDGRRLEYAKRWSASSVSLQKQDAYTWAAAQVACYKPVRILDIGCGFGLGLKALHKAFGAQIVTTEENRFLASATVEHLRRSKIDASFLDRVRYTAQGDSFETEFERGVLREQAPVTIIGTDILAADTELEQFLATVERFDLLTIWLIGTSPVNQYARHAAAQKLTDPRLYRESVHKICFQWANQFLRADGVIHIVDRGPAPDGEVTETDIKSFYEEYAQNTGFRVKSLTWKPYLERSDGRGIPMQSGGRPTPSFLLSVVAQRPPA